MAAHSIQRRGRVGAIFLTHAPRELQGLRDARMGGRDQLQLASTTNQG
jgi:hypothetical protein